MGKIRYAQLPPAGQEAYRRMEAAFRRYALEVDMSGLPDDTDFMGAMLAVLGDAPEIVYFDRTQIRVCRGGFRGRTRVELEGVPPLSRINRMGEELRRALEQAVEEIESLNPLTDYDRLISIYEYVQYHVVYDDGEQAASARLGESLNPQTHNAYGALVEGRAVCDGMSAGLALIAARMGYEATVVNGSALVETTLPTEHGWSLLRLPDGSFCHLDVTWDARRRREWGEYSYEYFCVSDDSIGSDHVWDINSTPPCSNETAGYYRRNRCYANNLSQLEEIFVRLARSRHGVVRAKLAEGIPVPEPQDRYLGDLLMRAAQGERRRARFTWNRGARCFFGKFE